MEQVMPGQAGAPSGLTLTLVDPMQVVKCCAFFSNDPSRQDNQSVAVMAGRAANWAALNAMIAPPSPPGHSAAALALNKPGQLHPCNVGCGSGRAARAPKTERPLCVRLTGLHRSRR